MYLIIIANLLYLFNVERKPNFKLELELQSDYRLIAGVDEVGRGAIAGPIVAGAVVFSDYTKTKRKLKGVNDSKKLTAKMRTELSTLIRELALDFAIGEVSPGEIDSLGIGAANILAFERALNNLKSCHFALIDGRKFRGFSYPFSCHEKGESKSLSIAAASIIAKVYRDELMKEVAMKIDQYSFEQNVGYGGKAHYKALEQFGPSEIHRRTFLNKFYERNQQANLF